MSSYYGNNNPIFKQCYSKLWRPTLLSCAYKWVHIFRQNPEVVISDSFCFLFVRTSAVNGVLLPDLTLILVCKVCLCILRHRMNDIYKCDLCVQILFGAAVRVFVNMRLHNQDRNAPCAVPKPTSSRSFLTHSVCGGSVSARMWLWSSSYLGYLSFFL